MAETPKFLPDNPNAPRYGELRKAPEVKVPPPPPPLDTGRAYDCVDRAVRDSANAASTVDRSDRGYGSAYGDSLSVGATVQMSAEDANLRGDMVELRGVKPEGDDVLHITADQTNYIRTELYNDFTEKPIAKAQADVDLRNLDKPIVVSGETLQGEPAQTEALKGAVKNIGVDVVACMKKPRKLTHTP